MHECDTVLKLLLRGPARRTMQELAGIKVERWLDVELPKIQNLRLDLPGEAAYGSLIHLEPQSNNDRTMPLRMAEYCLGIYRLLERFSRQLLIYGRALDENG